MEAAADPTFSQPAFAQLARELAELGRYAHSRGWALGTSGNFSAVLSHEPLVLAISSSGLDKALLEAGQIVAVDGAGRMLSGAGRPSDETHLHLALVRARGAGAVVHTHSVWSTLLSESHAAAGGLVLEGFEMLKGLEGVRTHQHREWLPILENSQDLVELAGAMNEMLCANPAVHGFFLRRHGLYTWGADLAGAKRHLEILEFLLEVIGRKEFAMPASMEAANGNR